MKMKMIIQNSNYTFNPATLNKSQNSVLRVNNSNNNKTPSASFKGPIIGRIQNIPAGCGGCGR